MPIVSYVNIQQEATPNAPKHLVTLEVVEQLLSGKLKAPVRLVSTTDLVGTYVGAPDFELTLTATGELEIDGVKVNVGDRVLLAGQTDQTQNGIYTVEAAGEDGPTPPAAPAELKRASDFNDSGLIQQGVTINVMEGDSHANFSFRLVTGGTITLDSTALEFVSVTPSTGAAKFAETITGDSVLTEFDVDHNLGSEDVTVQVFDLANHAAVLTDISVKDSNTVTIGFADAPTPSDGPFRVVVVG